MQSISRVFSLFGRCLRGRSLSVVAGICLCAAVIPGTGCLSRSLTGLTIQPSTGNTTIVPGVSAQFTAIGTYTMSGHQTTTEDITSQVQWSTVIPAVAAVNSAGLVTGVGIGTTSIIATVPGAFGALTATSNIVVNEPSGGSGSGGGSTTTRTLNAVSVVPSSQTLSGTGGSAQMLAMGTYNVAPTSANLTSSATWQSSNTSVATVNSAGVVTATGAGSSTITALATGPDGSVVQGSGTITVNVSATTGTRTLTAISVTPGSQALTSIGQTAQFLAVGTYTAAPTTVDITSQAAWASSDSSVATVDPSTGVVTATGTGTTTITAEGTAADGSLVTGMATVTVTASTPAAHTLTSLSIVPGSQSTGQIGETGQFLAIGTYSSAPLTVDLTNNVTWISSDPMVATVNNAGLATAVGSGTASITALATNTDGSVVAATGTLSDSASPGSTSLPTLAIYGAGLGSGTVTGTVTVPGGTTVTPINCGYTGPSTGAGAGTVTSGCTGNFQTGSTVTLTAAPGSGSVFGGWSSNCTVSTSTTCTITLSGNDSVGVIFDLQ